MQSKKQSWLEAISTVGSGFILAYLVWAYVVAPMITKGLIAYDDSFIITCIFTVVSLIRVYCWRRFYNWWQHLRVKKPA